MESRTKDKGRWLNMGPLAVTINLFIANIFLQLMLNSLVKTLAAFILLLI